MSEIRYDVSFETKKGDTNKIVLNAGMYVDEEDDRERYMLLEYLIEDEVSEEGCILLWATFTDLMGRTERWNRKEGWAT